MVDGKTDQYGYTAEKAHILMKVETHNHPTAISPYPGAATGSGGEIRDEGAVGRGGRPKAGLCGFSVSNLRLPDRLLPWEKAYGKPDRIVSPLEIMIEGPVGAASFNNEFGRPNILGYFRTLELDVSDAGDGSDVRGYHKPIMLAGGLGSVREPHVEKQKFPAEHSNCRPRRACHADRSRRRCCLFHGKWKKLRGSRLCFCAAQQCRDAAPLPGSDRALYRTWR